MYNPFDPSQTRISEGVYHYLKTFCTEMESKKHIHDTLQIITDRPIDGNRLKTAIQDAVKQERDEFDRQIAENNRKALGGYVIGILLSVGGVVLSLILDQVLLAIISFLGTSAISGAVTIQTTLNPGIKRQKNLLDPLCDFKLEVITANEDALSTGR